MLPEEHGAGEDDLELRRRSDRAGHERLVALADPVTASICEEPLTVLSSTEWTEDAPETAALDRAIKLDALGLLKGQLAFEDEAGHDRHRRGSLWCRPLRVRKGPESAEGREPGRHGRSSQLGPKCQPASCFGDLEARHKKFIIRSSRAAKLWL
jgi:hypothetical protein